MTKQQKFIWLIIDLGALLIAFQLTYYARSYVSPIQELSFYFQFLLFSILSFFLSFSAFGIYRERLLFSISFFVDIMKAIFLWGFLLLAFSFFTKADYSRFVVLAFIFWAMFFVLTLRFALIWIAPRIFSNGREDEILLDIRRTTPFMYENGFAAYNRGFFVQIGKRIIDILISMAAMVGLALIYPIIVFLIKRDSPGPVLICQRRVGWGGKEFMFYKFRTMRYDTPLYAPTPSAYDDPRITKIGRILRRYSIDELPQFWNVLNGDMSIVGPRPEMPFIVAKYTPLERKRLLVKPGITGLWQIFGRKDLPLHENLEYDLYYVLHQSFFLDLAIMLKTFPHLFIPRGAY